MVEVVNKKYFLTDVSDTFHGRDIFAPVAAAVANGLSLSLLGNPIDKFERIEFPEPVTVKNGVKGKIIYIDRFGNLMSNISKKAFNRIIGDGPFEISIKGARIRKISGSYVAGGENSPLAVFNSSDNLEIALNGASAEKLLRARRGDSIDVFSSQRTLKTLRNRKNPDSEKN
jgi:S-adenosylmethionine hydrolase